MQNLARKICVVTVRQKHYIYMRSRTTLQTATQRNIVERKKTLEIQTQFDDGYKHTHTRTHTREHTPE